jgi:GGDEF domain-containing protein
MDDAVFVTPDRLDLDPIARGLWETLLPHLPDALRGEDAEWLGALEAAARSAALARSTPVAALLDAYNDGCGQLVRLLKEGGGRDAHQACRRALAVEKPGLSRLAIGYCSGLEEFLAALSRAAADDSPFDEETGALKPREVISRLTLEAERCRRCDAPLGLAALAVVPPRAGPRGGAPVAKESARRLRDSLRKYDSLGRSPAGHFVVIMPDISRRGLVTATQRLCAEVGRRSGADPGPDVACAFSHYDDVDLEAAGMLAALQRSLDEARFAGGPAAP